MVQYTNVIVASALVASALPAFAAPLAQDVVEIEARQSGVAKAAIGMATDPAARFTITKPLKTKVKQGVKTATTPRPNNGGFLNSQYNSQRRPREFDEEEFFAREFDEEYIEARQSGVAKAAIGMATDPAARFTITKPLKTKVKQGVKTATTPRPNNGGFLNSQYNSQRRPREFDEEEFFAREFDEEYIEARQSGVAKAAIGMATDPAARFTITQPLKTKVKQGVKTATTPRPNNGGFLNSQYNSQRRPRDFDEEDILERDYFDELDLD